MCKPIIRCRSAMLAVCLAPSLALAGLLPARFTLGQYVPDYAWMYVHAVANPERAWIEQQWADVVDALKNSGIDRDITSLIMSALSDEDRAKAEETIQKVTNLLRGVNWGDLTRHEFVFAEGFPPNSYTYGYLLLVRGAENTAQGNVTGLLEIFRTVDGMSEQIKLVESKRNDVDLWSLRMGLNEKGEAAFVVDLLRRGDIIGLVADAPMGKHTPGNSQTLDTVLGLMAGQPGNKSILSQSRFQEAIGLVKPAEDSIAYFDMKLCLAGFGRLFTNLSTQIAAGKAAKKAGGAAEGDSKAAAEAKAKDPVKDERDDDEIGLAILQKVLTLADVFDYSITTTETDDRRELTHEAMRLQNGKESTQLAKAFMARRPFDRFDQFIPADATGFSVSGSVDLGALYKIVREFVAAEIPQGKEVIAQLDAKLAAVGFDPQRDVFDWLSGETISIDLPAAVVTPMGGADWVLMVRVKNPELAKAKVNAGIDFVNGKMKGQGQMLMISPAKVEAEGFREITHPMMAMFMRPVMGIQSDWLTIGSSSAAVNKCLAVASGKTPSIRENKRFMAEGLVPTGPVVAASFRDTSNFGQELAGAVGMMTMVGGMATAGIPDAPETRQAKKMVQSALGILMKLGPILQKIDFYSSESSMTTYDGALTQRTESVVTYKDRSTNEAPGTAKAPTAPVPPVPPEAPKPPRQ